MRDEVLQPLEVKCDGNMRCNRWRAGAGLGGVRRRPFLSSPRRLHRADRKERCDILADCLWSAARGPLALFLRSDWILPQGRWSGPYSRRRSAANGNCDHHVSNHRPASPRKHPAPRPAGSVRLPDPRRHPVLRGPGPFGQPDDCRRSRALLQEARLALGMDVWVPGWLQEDEQDETPPDAEAASKAAAPLLKPAKKMAPTTPPGDATKRNRNIS